jgi:hypothetical protein
LALIGIADSEAGDPIFVYHRVVGIQECERSISALLSVHVNKAEANTLVKVVVESNTHGKVRTRVEGATTHIIVDGSAGESVFIDPICARGWIIQTGNCAVTGRFNAIFSEEIDHGYDTSDVNRREVSSVQLAVVLVKIEGEDLPNATTFVGWSLELRKHILGDLSLADGIVVIMVFAGEDVDIGVVIIPTVTTGLAKGAGKHGRGKSQDGESGGS